MAKRILATFLIATCAAGIISSCGGSSSSSTTAPGNGSLFTLVADAPFCDVLTFRMTFSGMSLTPMGGGNASTLINSTTSAGVRVNLAAMQDFSTILNLSTVTAVTYDHVRIAFGSPTIVVFDPTQSPPVRTITGKLTSGTTTTPASFPINPPLAVTKVTSSQTQVSSLMLDIDAAHSLQLDSSGQVTGNVAPVITASAVTASASGGFGDMDGLRGFVTRVDPSVTSTTNTNIFGDFGLQLLQGSGPAVLTSLTKATEICGPQTISNSPCISIPLNELPTGSYAEVDGFVDQNGNLVANSVEIEDQEVIENNKLAFLGTVLSVSKDSNGNATQLELLVREEEPDSGFNVPLDSVVQVNLYASTVYQFSSRSTNFVNLPFAASSIAVGQELVVHGVFTRPPSQTPPPANPPLTTVAAGKVYVSLQAHQGSFVSLTQAGSDDRTGAFQLAPCASIFRGAPMLVFTDGQTSFLNIGGLSALTPQPSLLIKGLLFFEPQAITINGISVPAGSWVMLAKQVHALI